MSRIVVHRRAAKYLKSLSNPLQKRIKLVLSQLSEAPLDYPGVIRMAGDWSGFYRIRVGSIRVIFWVDENEDVIYIDHIGSRGDVYKK
jgi:mRNA interferase RelE/StbE